MFATTRVRGIERRHTALPETGTVGGAKARAARSLAARSAFPSLEPDAIRFRFEGARPGTVKAVRRAARSEGLSPAGPLAALRLHSASPTGAEAAPSRNRSESA